MGLKAEALEMTEKRQKVADAMDVLIGVARENDVGPIALSDLLLSVSSALCKRSGINKEDYVRAASQHWDESRAPNEDVVKH